MLALCLALRDKYNLAAVTNDIFTREDAEFLTRNLALPAVRIRAIETGGCPHAAVREDISANLAALEDLHADFGTDLLLIESGGDNLAANYSRELADFIIYVIDVSVRHSPHSSVRPWVLTGTCRAATRFRARADPGSPSLTCS